MHGVLAPSDSWVQAVAHKILLAAFHMLATGSCYRDLGDTFLDRLDTTRTVNALKRRIERLGYAVRLEQIPAICPAAPA